jgi:hypothetical protein
VACHCASGWICEAHPDHPWPHDDCAGPGEQCRNPECSSWQGSSPAAVSTEGWDVVYASIRANMEDAAVAKIGDTKPCVMCGDPAILKLVRPPDAAAVRSGGAMLERIPPSLRDREYVVARAGWECSECGHVQAYNDPLDA